MPTVITGDIISSSKLPAGQRQQLLNSLSKKLFAALRLAWRRKEAMRVESIQGDAFQIYLADGRDGLRAALLVKSFCRAQEKVIISGSSDYRFDCRLSIGTGSVRLLHPTTLAQSGGPAFEFSGRGLSAMPKAGPQLVFRASAASLNEVIMVALTLTAELSKHWTVAQSEAVQLKLTYPEQTQDWLAGRLAIGRSAYTQRLNQAGWPGLQQFLALFNSKVAS